MGTTRTSPVNADTDFGTLPDGLEDKDENGRIDSGETDPNDPRDDKIGAACTTDADCGAADSGLVCEQKICKLGCRGTNGNACPMSLECSSSTQTAGECVAPGTLPDAGTMAMADAGMSSADAGASLDSGMSKDAGSTTTTTTADGGSTVKKTKKKGAAPGTLGGGGCNCRTAGGPAQGDLLTILPALAALLLRRRRRV
jgi:MYXO-CTERM domain-containing protein